MNLQQFISSKYSDAPHFLLVGNPVGHSLSPLIHNRAAEYYDLPQRYHAIQLAPNELSSFAAYLNNELLEGVNVTIPYKQTLLSYVDELEENCAAIRALNTIVKKDGMLVGHNTDVFGFCKPLETVAEDIEEGRAIIFGTGGASRAVVSGLITLGVEEILLVSRSPHNKEAAEWPASDRVNVISYDAWPAYADETSIFVNTTPLGMEPDTQRSPVKESEIQYLQGSICYDIVYRPLQTQFLQLAAEANARTIGGLEMLIYQGSRSFELWTGQPFPIDLIRDTLKNHL